MPAAGAQLFYPGSRVGAGMPTSRTCPLSSHPKNRDTTRERTDDTEIHGVLALSAGTKQKHEEKYSIITCHNKTH